MKILTILFFMTIILTSSAFAPQDNPPVQQCGEFKPLVKRLMAERRLGFLSTSIDSHEQVYMHYLNNKTGDWVMLHIMKGAKRACIFMEGTDWQFILAPKIEPQP